MTNPLLTEFDGEDKGQSALRLDDGTGLRVVHAQFMGEEQFTWDLFAGYDELRVLTYSASVGAIVRMLDQYSFDTFECVFGCEGTLRDINTILAFQKVVIGDTRTAIMGLKEERHLYILKKVHAGQARFRVLQKGIAHAKLYLLSSSDGRNRVIVGSANLSERAFSGRQPETLVTFDNDEAAWTHYNSMFNAIRDSASDEIHLPEERISNAEIEIKDTPVISNVSGSLVIEPPTPTESQVSIPAQIERIEKVAAVLRPIVSPASPPVRNGVQRITPDVKRVISRIRMVKSVEEVDNPYFSVDRTNHTALLSGEPYSLEWDHMLAKRDAELLLDYFQNYDGAFEGDVAFLQRDYFILASWLYFSPFVCDVRSLALLQGSDVIRFPMFAIVFGKSNCGKTSLVNTLMTSMFGYAPSVEKGGFTRAQLRALQHSRKRLPVVFDDIGRRPFNIHGKEMIKDEIHPAVEEYPAFILSMNADPQSFPDEVVKRSMMIYTTTALPQHNEELRLRLQGKVQEMTSGLTGHLYRRYLATVMDHLDEDPLPGDWLSLSSGVLSDILSEFVFGTAPSWCQRVTWLAYAEKRYDRVKARLINLLRESVRAKNEGEAPNGWMVDGDKVIVWEQRDAFNRGGFDWEDVPSTLLDADASIGNRTVLHRDSLETFLGQRLSRPHRWWIPWARD